MNNLETATFANGCFWCTEAIFQQLRGVESITSGYSGGDKENPSYEEVSGGNTGFAEAIEVKFDPKVISYKDLLRIFFATHDPTTLNRQGADVGPQYRSAIFYHNDEQRRGAEEVKKEINDQKIYAAPIVTEITEFENFYKAENYHQNFYRNNKDYPYCKIVIDPKIAKFRKEFLEKLK